MNTGEGVKTYIETGEGFAISITQESDVSCDGGYTFEDVTNVWYLSKLQASELIAELQKFVDETP